MAAVAQLIPDDPAEKESVLAVLREHPELQGFIARVSEPAEKMFPEVRIELDTVQYDDWDRPVRMLVHGKAPWDAFDTIVERFIHRFARDPGFDLDLIVVMPMWEDPVVAAR